MGEKLEVGMSKTSIEILQTFNVEQYRGRRMVLVYRHDSETLVASDACKRYLILCCFLSYSGMG